MTKPEVVPKKVDEGSELVKRKINLLRPEQNPYKVFEGKDPNNQEQQRSLEEINGRWVW